MTTTGRKSGLPRTIEIWFVELGGAYYLVSETRHGAGWVKNLLKEPRVAFSIGTRKVPSSVLAETRGRARVIERRNEPELAREVSALMDQKYGWSDGLIVELAREH